MLAHVGAAALVAYDFTGTFANDWKRRRLRMATNEESHSAAVKVAWRIAARAARTPGTSIETSHLLYGVFSLDKLATSTLPPSTRTQFAAEVSEVASILDSFAISFQKVRRTIRREASISTTDEQSGNTTDT